MHTVRPLPTNWDGYAVIDLPFGSTQPRDLSRTQARQFFAFMMDVRDDRIAQLRGLVARNGYPTESAEDFQRSVVEFINAHVEAEERQIDVGFGLGQNALRVDTALAIWEAVGLDLGFLVGSALISEYPHLRWELLTRGGKQMDGYHFPVLTGFEHGRWPHFFTSPLTMAPRMVGGVADGEPLEPIHEWVEAFREFA